MERYDAILEQLKKAQGRGMETIANRLDFVVESLDELIREAKSTVQEALPESADECLPVDEIETALNAYRDEAEDQRQRAAEFEAKIGELEAQAEQATGGASIGLLRALDGASSQSELLKELLPAISEHVARAVVLVLRDGKVSAWSGIGFTDGEILRDWKGDAATSSALTTLLDHTQPVRFEPSEDELFSGWLAGEDLPGQVLLIPVVLRGKLMGSVYVDQLEGHPWDSDTAQTLVAQVCWLIDTLQYRTEAAPSLAEPVAIGPAIDVSQFEAPQVETDEPEIEAEEPQFEEQAAVEEEPEPTLTEDETPTDEPAAEEEIEEPEAEAMEDPSATMKIDVSEVGLLEPPSDDEDADDESPVDEDQVETAGESFEPSDDEDADDQSPVDEDQVEIAGESFEPDEPTEYTDEPGIAGESFEPDEPVEPELEVDEEASFEHAATEDEPEEVAQATSVEVEAPEPAPVEIPTEVQMPAAEPEDEEEEEEEEEEPEASAKRFLDEPPPVQPVQPPPDEPEEEISEDEAQREEARRFARLLVSEIKLYNEEQVERGREENDIYRRLQEDIDRSREMFEKRISAEIRAEQDYFHDELVRILADGNPEALGM